MRRPIPTWLVVLLGSAIALLAGVAAAPSQGPAEATLQFVITADAHYGLTRSAFRGGRNVDARVVNRALVSTINRLPGLRLPQDGGVDAGQLIGAVDFVAEAGDVTNREEDTDEAMIQPASASWTQFVSDYLDGLRLHDTSGARTPVFVVPGNHESSNAVGFYKHMSPTTDPTPLIDIYNRMVQPSRPLTAATYDYDRDRVFFTREFAGIHFVFLHVWPDSAMRARMERDLQTVSVTTPVIVVTHDQPEVEAKHFINPNGTHDVNATDQFENLLADRFADGVSPAQPSLSEQSALEAFLERHPNVTAYFHGNSNWQQVYDWNGPHRTARLHVFRVDSPMKGAVSSRDETKLSFDVVAVDGAHRTMTVRECLWNAHPGDPDAPPVWGESVTVALAPRPTR